MRLDDGTFGAAGPLPARSSRRHPLPALWLAFGGVHGLLILLALYGPGSALGDVAVVYRGWAEQTAAGRIPGITEEFVYPLLALIPILSAFVGGGAAYLGVWFVLVGMLNAAAFAILVRSSRGAAWWWLAFLLFLGPIALVRIDSITMALSILAVCWLHRRPFCSVVLLTVATWIKIWPIAVLAGVFVASRLRWRVLGVAAALSALFVAGAAWLSLSRGSSFHGLSFVGEQAGRGIQIESPVAVPWLWQAALRVPGSIIYYDEQLLTFQVAGPGVSVVSALMTPLLAGVMGAILLLGARVKRGGAEWSRVLAPLVLALTVALIAFNKVGSPQFIGWLAAPIILGLVHDARWFRTPAVLALVLAALTHLIYPYLYDWVILAHPLMVLVLTLRNLLEFILLGWALVALIGLNRPHPHTFLITNHLHR